MNTLTTMRKYLYPLIALLAFLTGGYAHAGAIDPLCPSTEFPAFLKSFSEKPAYQKKLIQYPLKSMYLNPGDLEPVYKNLLPGKIDFPILLSAKERKARGLALSIDENTPWKAKVILNQENTGYVIYYFFEREKNKDACWKLVSVENWST